MTYIIFDEQTGRIISTTWRGNGSPKARAGLQVISVKDAPNPSTHRINPATLEVESFPIISHAVDANTIPAGQSIQLTVSREVTLVVAEQGEEESVDVFMLDADTHTISFPNDGIYECRLHAALHLPTSFTVTVT